MRYTLFAETAAPRRAFTLVELLLVLGIIAILAALIIPAFMRTRERANAAVCVSNLRQIGTGIANYANDHNQFLPGNNHGAPGRWYLYVNPYVGKNMNSGESGWARPSVFICPSNDRKTTFNKYAIFLDVSYWCNLFLMPRLSDPAADGSKTWSYGYSGCLRLNQLPPNRILVADNPKLSGSSSYFMHYRNAGDAKSRRPYPPGPDNDIHSMARIHGAGVNTLFTDFSVRFMAAEEVNRSGSEIETGNYFGGLQ